MAKSGATLRYIVYDILRDFNQAFSEANISEYQITYWVIIHADRLRKLHIQKIDSGEYIHKFEVGTNADIRGRHYITLPATIYDFDLDGGVAYVAFGQSGEDPSFTETTFSRTTPAAARRLYFRDEETPSLTNPYFYRLNDDLYFLGLEYGALPYTIELGLYSTLDPTDLTLDIDQQFDFPQDLIPVLKRQILDMGLWALNVPTDLVNDGANIKEEVPQKKFISVNDLNQEQP